MTAVTIDRRGEQAQATAFCLAPLPTRIVVAGTVSAAAAALAEHLGSTASGVRPDALPDDVALWVGVDHRHQHHALKPRDAIGDFAGPVVLASEQCRATWRPTGGPVLIVPAPSSTGAVLMAHAGAWAQAFDVEVWLATVVDQAMTLALADGGRTDLLAAGLLTRMSRQLARAGITAGWDVLYGRNAATAVRSFAGALPPTLIAMEVGRPITRTPDLWSSAQAVARASAVPVLLLPPSAPVARPHAPVPPRASVTGRVRTVRPLPIAPPEPPAPAPPPSSNRRARATIAVTVLAFLSAALAALGQVRVPYDSVRPGAAPRLAGLIGVHGTTTYLPARPIRFLTVQTHRCTLLDAVRGWLDDDVDVVPDHLASDERTHAWRANQLAMAEAKTTALALSLRHLGLTAEGEGALVDVDIDTSGVVGPSAGLAFTLGMLDLLTPGDLAGPHDVAVTGTIDSAGHVGDVGGLRQKVIAARAAGVDLLIVPNDQRDAATAFAGGRIAVAGVGSLDDALDVLVRNGGDPI